MRDMLVLLLMVSACSDGGTAADTPDAGPSTPDAGASPPDAAPADALALTIDLTTIHVEATVTANGVIPDQSCTGAELRGQVAFYQEDGAASFLLPIPCADPSAPFRVSGDIYPGVYRVAVVGEASSLPPATITVATGLDLPAGRSDLVFDVTSRHLSGTLTQNGQTPTSQLCPEGLNRAQLIVEDRAVGSFFSIPLPCDVPGTPFTFSGTVPPGTYRISLVDENSSIPNGTRVIDPALVVQSDVSGLVYDLVTHHVEGSVTLNGAIPGQDGDCRGRRAQVIFDSASGSSVLPIVCGSAGTPFTFSDEVYAGSYTVTVSGADSFLPRPGFRHGTVDVSADVAALAIDVQTVPFAGTVTRSGSLPPDCTGSVWGEVSAYETTSGANFDFSVPCATGGPFAFSGAIYPGHYLVSASINDSSPVILARDLAPATGLVLDAAVTTHPVSGVVTLNGQAPGGDCATPEVRGTVQLDDLVTGISVGLPIPCAGAEFAFSGAVPPGSYRVTISGDVSNLPTPVYFLAAPLVVTGPVSNLHLDVLTRPVTGTITLGGQAPACAGNDLVANVSFSDTTTNITFSIPARCGAPVRFVGEVYPGTYEVIVYGVGAGLPSAGFRAATQLEVR